METIFAFLGLLAVFLMGLHVLINTGRMKRLRKRTMVLVDSLGLHAKCKICLSFYQVFNVLDTVYGVELNEDVSEWLHFLKILNLDPVSWLFPDGCRMRSSPSHNMISRLFAYALWPYGLSVLVLFHLYLLEAYKLLASIGGSTRTLSHAAIRRKWFPLVLIIFAVALLPVSSRIFEAHICEFFGFDDLAVKEEGRRRGYLKAEQGVLCVDPTQSGINPEYKQLQQYFWAFFVLWPVLVPHTYVFLLWNFRASARSTQIWAGSLHFLWRDYHPTFAYWEVFETVRKLVLVCFLNFWRTHNVSLELLQIIAAAAISMVWTMLLAVFRPYLRFEDLCLAMTSNLFLACIFTSGTIIKICNRGSELSEGFCFTYVGLHDSYKFSWIIIVLAVSTLVFATLICLWKLIKIVTARKIYMASTRREPVLDLPEDCTYHCFFSYSWATSRVQTCTIVRRLQELMQDLRIWHAFDNIDMLSNVEAGVKDSAVFVIFLDSDYFRSKCCRLELSAALSANKPIFIVWEDNDETMCGATVDDLILEPFETRDPRTSWWDEDSVPLAANVLDFAEVSKLLLATKPVEWMEEDHFYLHSLKLIVQSVIKHLPYYLRNPEKLRADELRVSGELKPAVWSGLVTLYVCDDNTGARAVAEELQVAASSGGDNSRIQILNMPCKNQEPPLAGVLLLYCNDKTFSSLQVDAVYNTLHCAHASKLPCVLVSEKDSARSACYLSSILEKGPKELLGINLSHVISLYPDPQLRRISMNAILRAIAGEVTDSGFGTRFWS